MKVQPLLIFIFIVLSGAIFQSCKSEFETVRASGDPEMLYKKAFEYYEQEEYQKAQTLFELVISAYRGRKEAEELFYKYAYTYYNLERYILAAYYFKNFSQTYSTSQYREEADFMAAYSNYKLSPTFRLDQTYTNKAIEELQLFVNTYPTSERVEESNRLIDEMRLKLERKAFAEGKLYFDIKQYKAAMHSLENLLKDFPDTKNAEEVRYLLIKSSYALAENSIVDLQYERFSDSVNKATAFLRRYKNGAYAKEVQDILDNATKKIKQLNNDGYQNQSARARS